MPEIEKALHLIESAEREIRAAALLEPDEWKWRRFGVGPLDLEEPKRTRAIELAERFFRLSPIANRMIGMITDFITGDGLRLEANTPEATAVLTKFWNSPENDLPALLQPYVRSFLTFGELCFEAIVNKINGFVTLHFIPPKYIEEVLPKKDDAFIPDRLRIQGNKREFKIIEFVKQKERYIGDVFFFQLSPLAGQLRGYPSLLALFDWIGAFDTYLYNRLERNAHFDSIWWDVELEGYTEAQIDEWLKSTQASPPAPGTVFAHNERVDWSLVIPDFKGRELAQEGGFYRDFMLCSAGLLDFEREHKRIRDKGEILDETIRHLKARQDEVKKVFTFIGKFVLQEAVAHGILPEDEYIVRCITPRLGVRDLQRSASAVATFAKALALAQSQGWVDAEAARDFFKRFLEEVGFGG